MVAMIMCVSRARNDNNNFPLRTDFGFRSASHVSAKDNYMHVYIYNVVAA